jgi:predicted MFS family arabinose efflux permease
MDSETRQMLLEAITLSRENNHMLRTIRKEQRWTRVLAIIKYIVIASLAFGAYVYLQPYLTNLTSAFNSIISGVEGLKGFKPF